MRVRSSALALVLTAWSLPALAQGLPTATPESVGLSSDGLERITERLQEHIDAGDIAGVVAGVIRHGTLVYFEALGERDLETGSPMPDDALFRLYSMTRPITSLAAMILWEEDKLALDDPVTRYLPQFESQRVFVDAAAPDTTRTRPRAGDITIQHLLTHSSGLGSRSSGIYRQEGVRLRSITLSQMVDNAARVPLFADPGAAFRYGISTTILGRVVEVVSGQPLEEFLQTRIFEPLGMTDTVFYVDPARAARLATVYRPSDQGELQPYEIEVVPFTERPTLIEGGVVLVSSTMDYLRFSQMFLNGGELDGHRVIRPETVTRMTANQLPDALVPVGTRGYMSGSGWGLGFNVVVDAGAYDFPMNDGDYWWDGSAGTRFFIDPTLDMASVIMAQVSPSRGNGFREAFKVLLDQAIVKR